ncbi:MAG: PqqD family protein [Acidobacteria bacterium]|nr:PqqD family protein [Acidobacteriota bacterium]
MTDLAKLAAILASERCSHASLADGTGVLLDIHGEQILALNATGEVLVGALLEGVTEAGLLAERLTQRFAVEPGQAREDAAEFMAGLEARLVLRGKG